MLPGSPNPPARTETAWTLVDGRDERRAEAEGFPLSLGGPGCDLVLLPASTAAGAAGPSDAEPVVAWLGTADGDLFVQPEPRPELGARLQVNGAPLDASRWLRPGDVVSAEAVPGGGPGASGGAEPRELAVEVPAEGAREAGRLVLRRRPRRSRPVLVPPPRDAEVAPIGAPVVVRPAEFRPHPLVAGGAGARSGAARRRLGRLRAGRLAALLLLLPLVLAVGFLFAAETVTLEASPEPDLMTVGGTGGLAAWLPALSFDGRHLLLPGRYDVRIEKAGHRPWSGAVDVTREGPNAHRFELERLPGRLVVATGEVEGATVAIDGEEVGETPLAAVELPEGPHEVRVTAPGYLEAVETVELAGGGREERLDLELVPERSTWAAIGFTSDPAGARLAIDGRPAGRTPATVELAPGEHRFSLSLEGFATHGGSVRVEAAEPRELPLVRLSPAAAVLRVTSRPAGAVASVDGTFRGETPFDLSLPGSRDEPRITGTVRLVKAGYEPAERSFELAPGEAGELAVELVPRSARLALRVDPPDARILVDGEPREPVRGVLELSARPHVVTVEKEGYVPAERRVTPVPGVEQTLEVTLGREGEPAAREAREAAAAAPAEIAGPGDLRLVRVEPGRLTLGASRREPGRRANEVERQVELTRPFYVATHEVTNREFRRFRPEHLSGQVGSINLEIDHHPAVRVSWEDAALFCNWLSEQEGLEPVYVRRAGRLEPRAPAGELGDGYRLPTEAEWAWVARFGGRGGEPRKYPWGDTLPVPDGAGNYGDVSAAGLLPTHLPGYRDGFPATAPGGSFPAGPGGIYDLGGNVSEWMHDVYTVSGGGALERDPSGPRSGDLHVVRGASWASGTVTDLRLTRREPGQAGRPDLGFRVARFLDGGGAGGGRTEGGES